MNEPEWNPAIDPMTKLPEYNAACAAGRATASESGDFWNWLAETYPNKNLRTRRAADYAVRLAQSDAVRPEPKLQPAQPQRTADGNHGLDAIVTKINKRIG